MADKKLLKRMNKARDFPTNTCGASRHMQIVAETLMKRGMIDPYDAEHVGESLAVTVASLWEARAFLQGLGYTWEATEKGTNWVKQTPSPETLHPSSDAA